MTVIITHVLCTLDKQILATIGPYEVLATGRPSIYADRHLGRVYGSAGAIGTDRYPTRGTQRHSWHIEWMHGTRYCAVPCRAVGSVLASLCHMRTVDFELILCRQVGDKFLFVIELSGFPAIHQSAVGMISDCVYLYV